MKLVRIATLACLVPLLGTSVLAAQVLSGRVCDYESSIGSQIVSIPGVEVVIAHEGRTLARQITGSAGSFSFSKLPVGVPLTIRLKRVGYLRWPTVQQFRIEKTGSSLGNIFLVKEGDAASADRIAARFVERLEREGATYGAETELLAGFGLPDSQQQAILARATLIQNQPAQVPPIQIASASAAKEDPEEVITVTPESLLPGDPRISTEVTVAQTEFEKLSTSHDPWAILQSTPGDRGSWAMMAKEFPTEAPGATPAAKAPAPASAAPSQSPAPIPDPDGAKIFTDDIGRFWEAFDQAGPAFPAETFQKVYLDRGSPGLRDFLKLRIQSAERLARTVQAHPGYYASIRESTGQIREMEKDIRASFYALEYLVPEAVFPDVYFVVGVLNSGGTVSDQGLLIGVEMYGRTPKMPEEELGGWLTTVLAPVVTIPHIVAHELIHYQQKYPETEPTLLSQSIREGSADFLAEMISGRHINAAAHAYAVPRRAELWREFQGKMHGKDFAGWLYSSSGDRPNDLGYWMGYEITQAFYDKATDKRRALKEILEIKDFDAFLAKSGYAERFALPKTVP